jgi:uncharacterized protein (DUF1810 family)
MSDLTRFITAQEHSFEQVCRELAAGRKQSHWMWYVFPQLQGLGRSETARYFGLEDLQEAQAYWQHPWLGPRLDYAAALVEDLHGKSANDIFASPDDLKFRSCLTLFEVVAPGHSRFANLLERYYGGIRDRLTLDLLDGSGTGLQT